MGINIPAIGLDIINEYKLKFLNSNIEQLKSKKVNLFSYLPIPLGFFLLMLVNFLMSDGVDTNEVIQQTIKMIGVNLTFVALVGPLAFGLLIVLFLCHGEPRYGQPLQIR